MLQGRERIDHYLAWFEAARAGLPGDAAWLAERRREAVTAFAQRGFPTRKDEDWRCTSVEALAGRPFREMAALSNGGAAKPLEAVSLGEAESARLVFVNGHYRGDLSHTAGLPAGSRSGSLAAALTADGEILERHLGRLVSPAAHPFAALNTALWRDGALLVLPDGAVVDGPVHLVFLAQQPGDETAAHLRNLVIAGARSRVTVVETYWGGDGAAYWTNPVTEVVAGEGSVVEHCKVQREGADAFHLASIQAHLERDAAFTAHSVSLGGHLVRNDVRAVLAATGADCTLNGLYLLDGTRHEDNHTLIDHAEPHGTSRELYKGVLDGASHAVFNGGVHVRPHAQKTDSRQTNKNLLLSDDAQVDTKPELEIHADDVKCAHGATVGRLDPDGLFYLRSRGLDAEAARSVMIYAFAGEVLGRIRMEGLRRRLQTDLAARLPSLALGREDL